MAPWQRSSTIVESGLRSGSAVGTHAGHGGHRYSCCTRAESRKGVTIPGHQKSGRLDTQQILRKHMYSTEDAFWVPWAPWVYCLQADRAEYILSFGMHILNQGDWLTGQG
eukprot:CAMPEP_0174343600 /NCGR_PEP_ID=MMETSP0810-20121108/27081_1 /TAXON_ID=73025 ORGANISM="Eutreptiella gymnastica-like, Strain CCMP1594" /NCGR_SAMPLE_ID=MMETSP0810 /ASSEMBLY_ACC=CAM_ASM_000659 /LENGTH=109 /DNA_ID=CAMNT_0015466413 /DNA_START=972 /DNA_END=1301 /DNA_ORIENTATION=-